MNKGLRNLRLTSVFDTYFLSCHKCALDKRSIASGSMTLLFHLLTSLLHRQTFFNQNLLTDTI